MDSKSYVIKRDDEYAKVSPSGLLSWTTDKEEAETWGRSYAAHHYARKKGLNRYEVLERRFYDSLEELALSGS